MGVVLILSGTLCFNEMISSSPRCSRKNTKVENKLKTILATQKKAVNCITCLATTVVQLLSC